MGFALVRGHPCPQVSCRFRGTSLMPELWSACGWVKPVWGYFDVGPEREPDGYVRAGMPADQCSSHHCLLTLIRTVFGAHHPRARVLPGSRPSHVRDSATVGFALVGGHPCPQFSCRFRGTFLMPELWSGCAWVKPVWGYFDVGPEREPDGYVRAGMPADQCSASSNGTR